MKRPATLAITAAIVPLVLAGVASAAKIKHEGKIDGAQGTAVGFAVKKKDGELTRITSMSFRDVPVSCSDGSSGTVTGLLPGFPLDGDGFTRRAALEGSGIDDGRLRVSGEFDRGGRRASGRVRLSFESTASGADCRTGKVAWKTARKR